MSSSRQHVTCSCYDTGIAWKLLTWLNNNYSLSASSQRVLFHFLQRTVPFLTKDCSITYKGQCSISYKGLFHFLQRTEFHFLQRTVPFLIKDCSISYKGLCSISYKGLFHFLLSWYSHKSIWLSFLTKDLCLLFLIMWAGEYYSVRGSGINYTSKLKNLSIIQHISEWILFMLLTISARRGAGTEIPPPPFFSRVLCSFLCLCCLSSFDLRLLITPLISSNFCCIMYPTLRALYGYLYVNCLSF